MASWYQGMNRGAHPGKIVLACSLDPEGIELPNGGVPLPFSGFKCTEFVKALNMVAVAGGTEPQETDLKFTVHTPCVHLPA